MKFKSYHGNHDLSKYSFLVTGGAGFVGCNIVNYLVQHKAGKVRILDNLSTGKISNIEDFLQLDNVEFLEGDIRSFETCEKAVKGMTFVSHQAALGSVPRSIKDPITTNEVNIDGFLNILSAAKNEGIIRLVYAASSSTYGDNEILPKQEDVIGKPLSPYAVTKYVNELYAGVFSRVYDFHTIGLRYFNVFGPFQNPSGAYAAVVPLFISTIQQGKRPIINGTGKTSRDFTFVSNVVQANIKSMLREGLQSERVLNIACGCQTTLIELVDAINAAMGTSIEPVFGEFRKGDVMHSLADITKAKNEINYEPEVSFEQGIRETVWFHKNNNE